jgi:hypothetical protein
MSTIINATTTNGVVIQPDNSGSLVLQTNNGTTALTIDTSQNITTANKLAVASMPTGSVVQVVNATHNTEASTASATLSSTGFSVSITPSSASNKILLISKIPVRSNASSDGYGACNWQRGGTNLLASPQTYEFGVNIAPTDLRGNLSYVILDSPASTSSVTYTLYFQAYNPTFYICPASFYASVTLMEIKG